LDKDLVSIKEALSGHYLDQRIQVAGWVRTRRDSKAGVSFIELSDGSCPKPLQLVIPKELPNYETEVLRLGVGASLMAKGLLVNSIGRGQALELQVEELKVLGHSDPSAYPLQKKRHSFEFLRSIPHLRVRTNTFGAMARLRSNIAWEIHRFFQEKGFFYVHTPIITPNDCEGAGELFAVKRRGDATKDEFFGRPAYLTVSGQLELEAYALALGRVYSFGPTFRAEDSNTTRHLAEFWMVEPEAAFLDLQGDIELAQEFLTHIFQYVLEKQKEELLQFEKWISPGLISQLESTVDKPFTIITYSEAIDALKISKEPFQYPVEWGLNLQTEHERYLTERYIQGPVVVIDYPKDIKPFYMKMNPDEKTVRAMDVLLPKWGEIIGGSEREDDLSVLELRMDELGMDKSQYWWYLDLRRYGSAPHAGFGLGFERLLLYITGLGNIRDTIPYPRSPNQMVV